jgi:hypothetical protein
MKSINKTLLSSSIVVLIMAAAATTSLAQSSQLKNSSDLSIQNTQSLLASNAERFNTGIAPFLTRAAEAEPAKSMSFEMPSMIDRTMPKGSDWDQLTDEAKKAFGDQFGSGALRWSAGSGEKISGAGNGKSGLFVNRGPQPLATRVPQIDSTFNYSPLILQTLYDPALSAGSFHSVRHC